MHHTHTCTEPLSAEATVQKERTYVRTIALESGLSEALPGFPRVTLFLGFRENELLR